MDYPCEPPQIIEEEFYQRPKRILIPYMDQTVSITCKYFQHYELLMTHDKPVKGFPNSIPM